MGIFKNGILSAFSGKMGTVVGYELNGQAIGRSLPRPRTKKASLKELANRKKFGDVQLWLKPLTVFLRIGFKNYDPKFQGFVAAKSYNSKNAVTGEYPDFVIDPALALVSFGHLSQATSATAVSDIAATISFNWSGGELQRREKAMILLYDIENKKVLSDTSATWRAAGKFDWVLEPRFSGKSFHCYLAFVMEDQTDQSISQYLGEITVM